MKIRAKFARQLNESDEETGDDDTNDEENERNFILGRDMETVGTDKPAANSTKKNITHFPWPEGEAKGLL